MKGGIICRKHILLIRNGVPLHVYKLESSLCEYRLRDNFW